MKLLRALLFLTGTGLSMAATTVEIDAKFADVAAGTEIPATAEKLDKLKGIEVLSAPRVVTSPGKTATLEVTQDSMVPGSKAVPIGLTLSVTPTIGEKTIQFTGKAIDRATHGRRSSDRINTVEFATRELYFEGNTASGGTVILHSAPVAAKGEKTVSKSRELVVFLTFTKKETESAPTKKTTTSAPAKKTESKAATKSKPAPTKKKK